MNQSIDVVDPDCIRPHALLDQASRLSADADIIEVATCDALAMLIAVARKNGHAVSPTDFGDAIVRSFDFDD